MTTAPTQSARPTFLAAGVVVFVATAVLLAPAHAIELLYFALTDGIFLLLWLLAAWGYGSVRPVLAVANDRLLHQVTRTAIGLGGMSIALLLLGTLGVLNQIVALALIAIGIALAVRRLHADRLALGAWFKTPLAGSTWLTLLVVPPLALAAVGALLLPGVLWGADDPAGYDVVAYHLQLPRQWFEIGRVVPLRHNVFSFFPLNVEMHYLLAMHLRGGPFAGMYLAQLMHTAFIGLTVVAIYASARSRGPLAASVAAIVTASIPWLPMLGAVAYNEGGLMLYATLAMAWTLRGRWALAGACAGLAAGCKPTGLIAAVVLVPLVAMLGAGLRAMASGSDRALSRSVDPPPSPLPQAGGGVVIRRSGAVRGFAIFAGIALLVVSPWLVRTAVAAGGNPVFPLALKAFGSGQFDAGQVDRFEVAHSPRVDQQSLAGRAAALWAQVMVDPHYGTAHVSGVPLALWLILLPFALALNWRDRGARAWLLLIVGNVAVWLFATHLQGRFLAHAIPCVGVFVAFAVGSRRWFAGVIVILCVGSMALTFPKLIRQFNASSVTLGLPDPSLLRALLPPDVAGAIYDTDRPLILVGDAKAFWYAVPQRRITYRSVFDVPSDQSFRDAWLGSAPPADAMVIVDPDELARFERTYAHLPRMPDAWRDRHEVFVTDVNLR